MKLMTSELLKKIPPLYSQDGKDPSRVKVVAKFFNPTGAGTWYVTEYNPEERMLFGYAHIIEGELGYFSLDELESLRLPFGHKIERDIHWDEDTSLQSIMDRGY